MTKIKEHAEKNQPSFYTSFVRSFASNILTGVRLFGVQHFVGNSDYYWLKQRNWSYFLHGNVNWRPRRETGRWMELGVRGTVDCRDDAKQAVKT